MRSPLVFHGYLGAPKCFNSPRSGFLLRPLCSPGTHMQLLEVWAPQKPFSSGSLLGCPQTPLFFPILGAPWASPKSLESLLSPVLGPPWIPGSPQTPPWSIWVALEPPNLGSPQCLGPPLDLLTSLSPQSTEGDSEDTDLQIFCVSCGHPINPKVALRHMERCYAKVIPGFGGSGGTSGFLGSSGSSVAFQAAVGSSMGSVGSSMGLWDPVGSSGGPF